MFKRIFEDKKPDPTVAERGSASESAEAPVVAGAPVAAEAVKPKSKKKAPIMPMRIPLAFPFQFGSEVVRELVCENRPSMRTVRRIMSVSDADGAQETIEIIFYDLFGVTPKQLDQMDAEDGLSVINAVFDAFPFLRADGGLAPAADPAVDAGSKPKG